MCPPQCRPEHQASAGRRIERNAAQRTAIPPLIMQAPIRGFHCDAQDIRNQKYWLRHVGCHLLPQLTGGQQEAEGEGVAASQGVVEGPMAQGRAQEGPRAAATTSGPSPFGGLAVDEELFGWAVAVAMSRCFGLSRCGGRARRRPGTDALQVWKVRRHGGTAARLQIWLVVWGGCRHML